MIMKRITPRTCLWPLTGVLCATFALSIGLTYRSDHHCYAGTCGEWLFPFQARLHVVVWYMWISLSVVFLSFRALQPSVRSFCARPLGIHAFLLEKQLRVGGLLLIFWLTVLYSVLTGIWWVRLRDYFQQRGEGLYGNNVVAAVALTGHFADVTMGMILLPVSRHSALASFFRLSPTTTYTFHMIQAYVLFGLIVIHGSLYVAWVSLYNQHSGMFRSVFPVLNPTYLYNEVWPGNSSALGTWRASLIFSGSISALIMMAMFFTSFTVIRRNHFNVFYFTHLLGIVAVIVICLHASTMLYCTLPGFAMWFLDWGMRLFELRQKLPCQLKAIGNGWYTLTAPLPRKRLSGCACHSPLAHFYIYHSESSIREIHPFTTTTHLASKSKMIQEQNKDESSISIQFLFKPSMRGTAVQQLSRACSKKKPQWTHKLASVIDEEKLEVNSNSSDVFVNGTSSVRSSKSWMKDGTSVNLRLEGPYFIPANPESYKTVVCLVAGTGLSGAIAIAAAFQAQSRRPSISRSPVTCTPTNDIRNHWERCVIVWSVRETDFVDIPALNALECEGFEFRVCKTGGTHARPNMTELLKEICGNEGDSWCYISGPNGFITAAEKACNQIKNMKWFAARWD